MALLVPDLGRRGAVSALAGDAAAGLNRRGRLASYWRTAGILLGSRTIGDFDRAAPSAQSLQRSLARLLSIV